MSAARSYRTTIGSQSVDLPLVPVADDCSIALLICVDMGVHFGEVAGRELAGLLAPARPELVVSVATMGIPLAIEVSRALGLDDYLIVHKTPKIHLGESLAEPVRSITTDRPQMLRMDPRRAEAVRGRRVAVVDDVISTGASTAAALSLVRRVGGVAGGRRRAHDRGTGVERDARRRQRQRGEPRLGTPVPARTRGPGPGRGLGSAGDTGHPAVR